MKKHQYPPEQCKLKAKVEEDRQNLPTCGVFGGDALVLMTAHREFRELDLRRVKERMRTPIIIDGRRVFDQSHASGGRVQHFGWTILKQDW